MSVKPVKAISIIGLMPELHKVIQFCGESRVFHPDDAMSFYSNTRNFVPLNEKNPYSAPLQSLRSAADMAGFELKFTGLEDFDANDGEVVEYVEFLISKLEKMVNDRLRCKQEKDSCLRKIEQVGHFVGNGLGVGYICEIANAITHYWQHIVHDWQGRDFDSIDKKTKGAAPDGAAPFAFL